MKAICIDGAQTFGPYDSVVDDGENYIVTAGGRECVLPKVVMGDGVTLAEWVGPVPEGPFDLAAEIAAALAVIDADTDAIYAAVIGNRGPEYTAAEAEASAYAQAGYQGPVPVSVTAWAQAKGWTDREAADDILTTAAAWTAGRNAMRAARLMAKEQGVRAATTREGIAAALAQWRTVALAIRAQLGVQ